MYSSLAAIIYGAGWNLFLTYDKDPRSLIGVLVASVTGLAHIVEIVVRGNIYRCVRLFVHLTLWASWILFVVIREEQVYQLYVALACILIGDIGIKFLDIVHNPFINIQLFGYMLMAMFISR